MLFKWTCAHWDSAIMESVFPTLNKWDYLTRRTIMKSKRQLLLFSFVYCGEQDVPWFFVKKNSCWQNNVVCFQGEIPLLRSPYYGWHSMTHTNMWGECTIKQFIVLNRYLFTTLSILFHDLQVWSQQRQEVECFLCKIQSKKILPTRDNRCFHWKCDALEPGNKTTFKKCFKTFQNGWILVKCLGFF